MLKNRRAQESGITPGLMVVLQVLFAVSIITVLIYVMKKLYFTS